MSIRQREGVDEGVCEAGRGLGGVVPSTRTVGRPPTKGQIGHGGRKSDRVRVSKDSIREGWYLLPGQ